MADEITNPFVIGEYEGEDFFCDRAEETARLVQLITNGNNVVLSAPRRVGKTNLIYHLFNQEEIKKRYIPIIVDIYSTHSMAEMVSNLGKAITEALRSRGKAFVDAFVNFLYSVRSGFTFDNMGIPVWGVGLNYNPKPEVTLDEIFKYIEASDRPCLIAIDESQQINYYPRSSSVEALLRTYIQRCHNARFVFSGSHRHLMAEMFLSASRPFFQSATLFGLPLLKSDVYAEFCQRMFCWGNKNIDPEVAKAVYERLDGVTLYMQKVMNELFAMTPEGATCHITNIDSAIDRLIDTSADAYTSMLYQMSQRQRDLMLAIAHEGKARAITSAAFIKKHHLPSQSSVSSTAKLLVEKDFLYRDQDTYTVYDRFFALWLQRR